MKNFKRVLLTVVSAMLLVTLTIAGTLAYLTATSDEVKNTFTVGKVQFNKDMNNGLDEAKVDVYGNPIEGADRVTANEYKLLPGHPYIKDPTVHIADGSEPCYVFIEINKTTISYTKTNEDGTTTEVNIEAAGDANYTTIAEQMTNNGWKWLRGNIYYYENIVDTLNDATAADFVIFENFKLADDAVLPTTEDEQKSMEIVIKAYAVQADGFQTPVVSEDGAAVEADGDSAAAAWGATFGAPEGEDTGV